MAESRKVRKSRNHLTPLEAKLANRGNTVAVLHAFRKTTQKTEKRDIDLAKARFKQLE